MTTPDAKPEEQFVEFTHPHGHLVARIMVPSVGQAEAPVVREQIAAHMARTPAGYCFVLDVSQVSLLSSLGLGVCVDLQNLAKKSGLRPILFGMNRHLEDLFALMRIDRLFQVARTSQELDQLLAS